MQKDQACSRPGVEYNQMYSSTSTSTWFWDEYKYKYEYSFFNLSEYKYKYIEKVLKYEYKYILLNIRKMGKGITVRQRAQEISKRNND